MHKTELTKEQIVEYLAGRFTSENLDFSYDNSGEKKKRLSNPIKEYWQQVNQFLFSGGVHIDVAFADLDDPRQLFLDKVIAYNKLKNNLYSSFQKLSIHGELLVTISLTEDNKYIFSYYNKHEFTYNYEDGELKEVHIYTKRKKDNKTFIFKQKFTHTLITDYPLVEENKAADYNWESHKIEKPNNYNDTPCVIIQNSLDLSTERGEGDFDASSLDIACAILMCMFDALENSHYMGDPALLSPDPETTIKELQNRAKVLTKFPPEDGGNVETLNYEPIANSSFTYMEKLEVNFKKAMGIRYTDDEPSSDTSSITLKILNSQTISKAEEKWDYLVNQGFIPLLEKVLKFAYIDNLLLGYNPKNHEDYTVTIRRLKPYFPETNQEKLTKLSIVETLTSLGISPLEALKEYYAEKSTDEIKELLTNADF